MVKSHSYKIDEGPRSEVVLTIFPNIPSNLASTLVLGDVLAGTCSKVEMKTSTVGTPLQAILETVHQTLARDQDDIMGSRMEEERDVTMTSI